MKCKNCKTYKGDLKGICNNPKSDNYTDFVYKEMECPYGVSGNEEHLDYWKYAEKEIKKSEIVDKFANEEVKITKGKVAIRKSLSDVHKTS